MLAQHRLAKQPSEPVTNEPLYIPMRHRLQLPDTPLMQLDERKIISATGTSFSLVDGHALHASPHCRGIIIRSMPGDQLSRKAQQRLQSCMRATELEVYRRELLRRHIAWRSKERRAGEYSSQQGEGRGVGRKTSGFELIQYV